jgi:type I restriction enzyme M protein
MIDASKGFEKDGPKNRLRPRDMHKIVDAFVNQKEIDRYARMVPLAEIRGAKNGFNLNITRYIDSSEPEDIQDLHAHLRGGIPDRDLDALQPFWDAFPSLRAELFKLRREGYSDLVVDQADLQATITSSSEYQAFAKGAADTVASWWAGKRNVLLDIDASRRPNELIHDASEALLEAFRPRPLIDEYGVYEQLMSYWNASMHDDVALIVSEGWGDAAKPRLARTWKDKNNKTKCEGAQIVTGVRAGAKRWVMDLIPPEYVIARFFPSEKAELDALIAAAEAASHALNAYIEDHAIEEGLLWDAVEDDKLTKAQAAARLRVARREGADPEEIEALSHVISLYEVESATKKKVQEASAKLEQLALAQYPILTRGDIQTLVIDDKWGGTIRARVGGEVTALGQSLVARLQVLAHRYQSTVGELEAAVEALNLTVAEHLASMGVPR